MHWLTGPIEKVRIFIHVCARVLPARPAQMRGARQHPFILSLISPTFSHLLSLQIDAAAKAYRCYYSIPTKDERQGGTSPDNKTYITLMNLLTRKPRDSSCLPHARR
jgi:hypothetical protein